MIVVVAAGPVAARVLEAVGDGIPVSLAARTGGCGSRCSTVVYTHGGRGDFFCVVVVLVKVVLVVLVVVVVVTAVTVVW